MKRVVFQCKWALTDSQSVDSSVDEERGVVGDEGAEDGTDPGEHASRPAKHHPPRPRPVAQPPHGHPEHPGHDPVHGHHERALSLTVTKVTRPGWLQGDETLVAAVQEEVPRDCHYLRQVFSH